MTTAQTRPALIAGRGLGWRPDLPDQRDYAFAPDESALTDLPAEVRLDLDPAMPAPYDQGQLGSCTANALGAAVAYQLAKEGKPAPAPSRLFIYWNERDVEGTTDTDSGAQIRDGVKVLAADGVCPETEWPYDIGRFTIKPSAQAYRDAATAKVTRYERVARAANHWQAALAAGRPIVGGFSVYESFEAGDWPGFVMPMPERGEQLLGGHAVAFTGYATVNGVLCWRLRNSWGTGWGDHGNFWMPAAYFENANLADDAWTLRA